MSADGNQNTDHECKLGAVLRKETYRLGQELRKTRLDCITKLVTERILAVRDDMKAKKAVKPCTHIGISVEDLGVDPEEIKPGRDSDFWRDVLEWSTGQELVVKMDWKHVPACHDYDDRCAPGCGPTTVTWSWA